MKKVRLPTRGISDKDGLKRELFSRIQARGERATPALVEKELSALERAHAAQRAIDAVRAAGGTAHYFSVNLTDAKAVTGVIEQVRRRNGDPHVRVGVHPNGAVPVDGSTDATTPMERTPSPGP